MNAAYQQMDAVCRQRMTPVIEQIPAPSLDLCVDSLIQDQTPILTAQEPAKMKTATERLTYIEKLATLALQYLELSLPLPAALRAAEADL